jgi:ribosomal protein S18 acetylase RimI-like enzyme
MNIYPITENDIDIVVGYMQALQKDDPEEMPNNTDTLVKKIQDSFKYPNEVKTFLVEDNGISVGYFVLAFGYSFEFGGRIIMLDEMYVDPSARGKGYAKAMIDFTEQFARDNDCKSVYMVTTQSNEYARNLYRKYGYSDMIRYDHYKFLP